MAGQDSVDAGSRGQQPAGNGVDTPSDAPGPKAGRRNLLMVAIFLAPALVLLGALVVYPIFFSLYRSLYDRAGDTFVGLDNYGKMLTSPETLTAVRNTVLWVVIVPAFVTAIGLVFAVMTERVKFGTAFKVVIFMPMAISFLSAGVIWRIVYEDDPSRGLLNAGLQGIVDVVRHPGPYPGARPSEEDAFRAQDDGYVMADTLQAGTTSTLGLVAIPPDMVPAEAQPASAPASAPSDGIAGTVWLDFAPGGGGERGVIDANEKGLPGATVDALDGSGGVVASATSDADGRFVITGLQPGQEYQLALDAATFREPFGGFTWLAPPLITPAIMVSYVWIWAGFAMVVIASGLAAIPREMLEAARVDGATEWKVFRRVTVPLLAPVLSVVLVTLIINVLKVFDLVFVIAPGSAQRDANVIALEMWRASFGGARDFGLGSALAIFLFVLVLPAMAFNLKRFRAEQA